ncbi:MAG TPA: VOC family protein [Acidimicrobiales bacterium]|nr:VOC family protein [Acidimicrobiales bacterium]
MKIKELGHAVLFVKNVERSVHFYRDVLGFHMIEPKDADGRPLALGRVAMFSSGRTHHELLLIEVGEDAPHPGRGHRSGLYHLGFKIGDTDDELRSAIETLKQEGVTIVGTSDHTATHSLYLLDPDGNEIELYIDVAGIDWNDPTSVLAPTKALSL